MRLREQRLWDAFKKEAKKNPRLWPQRVENVCVPGMPDIVVTCSVGNTAWVELKSVVVPKRETTPLLPGAKGLSVAQRNWHLKAASMNARSFILVRAGKEVFLIRGRDAGELHNWPISEVRERAVAADWPAILTALER